jgi:hypothetical protein
MEGLTYERFPTHFVIRDVSGRVVAQVISDRSAEDVIDSFHQLNVRPYVGTRPASRDITSRENAE